MEISVLMSVYCNTTKQELTRCLNSLAEQTTRASEIVIVRDGPIDDSVTEYLNTLEAEKYQHVFLEKNQGLGVALAKGLLSCRCSLVARMDSDDYCPDPTRFACQGAFLEKHPNISACGGNLIERYEGNDGLLSLRRVMPINSKSIAQYAKLRNPINHQTVMFRKQDVLDAGNYLSMNLFEDYYLWARMLKKGFLLSNLNQDFAATTVEKAYFERRGGVNYLLNEVKLVQLFYRIKFLSTIESLIFLAKRLPMRVLPVILRRKIYIKALRKKC